MPKKLPWGRNTDLVLYWKAFAYSKCSVEFFQCKWLIWLFCLVFGQCWKVYVVKKIVYIIRFGSLYDVNNIYIIYNNSRMFKMYCLSLLVRRESSRMIFFVAGIVLFFLFLLNLFCRDVSQLFYYSLKIKFF